jgi:hypothetical protein
MLLCPVPCPSLLYHKEITFLVAPKYVSNLV